jgi:anti-sigma factor RsiW
LSEHLTQRQGDDYCRQRLSVAELLSVSDHLEVCETCRRQVENLMDGDSAFFAVRSEIFSEAPGTSPLMREHATVEQTAGYVDGSLSPDEHQRVTDHLSICEQCVVAVNDLRVFRKQIAADLDHEYLPAPPARTTGWMHRVASPLLLRRSPALAFGTALMVLVLAVTGWLTWQAIQRNKTKSNPVVTNPPSDDAPPVPDVTPAPSTAPEQVIAQLNDGEVQLTLDQKGKLSGADSLPPAYQSMLKEALTSQRLERSPLLAGLSRPSSSLMSGDKHGNTFSVLDPLGKLMLSDRPTFRWSGLDGATGYVVEVYDGQFNLVSVSPQLTERSWAPPQPLKRGRVYSWQVKAIKEGQEFKSPSPPAPQAKFRILDQVKASELEQARRAYASSHLTLGLLYVQAGLLEEAHQEFLALQRANPDSEIARRLLDNLQSLHR